MKPNTKAVEKYLSVLFGDALEQDDLHICIFAIPTMKSVFCRTIDKAVKNALAGCNNKNIYVGMGLMRNVPAMIDGKQGRGEHKDIDAITALWVDVDIRDPKAHKKANLPANHHEAKQLVDRIGVPPSFIVRSGYGLHAYWLLTEPWVFGSPAERELAGAVSHRWSETAKAVAHEMGFEIDSTFDLTRILRVAGTLNHKGDNPKAVTVDWPDQVVTYNIEELERFMIAEEMVTQNKSIARVESVSHLRIDPNVDPPTAKMMQLVDGLPQFRDTWNKDRPDFRDSSMSSYDMALANMALRADWTDQEMADLVIAFRRTHGSVEDISKSMRVDYLQRTIASAKSGRASAMAVSDLTSDEHGGPPVGMSDKGRGLAESERAKLLDLINKALGLRIARIVQIGRERPRYRLYLETGEKLYIGPTSNLTNLNTLSDLVFGVTRYLIPTTLKKNDWRKIINRIGQIIEIEENPEADPNLAAMEWLRMYLSGAIIHQGDEWSRALLGNQPFLREGRLYISCQAFRKWVRIEHGENIPRKDFFEYIKEIGFGREDVQARVDGSVTSRSYWCCQSEVVRKLGLTAAGSATQNEPPI